MPAILLLPRVPPSSTRVLCEVAGALALYDVRSLVKGQGYKQDQRRREIGDCDWQLAMRVEMGVGNAWRICVVHAIGASVVCLFFFFQFIFFFGFLSYYVSWEALSLWCTQHEPCRQLQNTAEKGLEVGVKCVLLTWYDGAFSISSDRYHKYF